MNIFKIAIYVIPCWILLLSNITLFNSCVVNKPKPCQPNSKEVTYLESPSSNEISCRSTGKGETFALAFEDSKRASIWFAINYILKRNPNERNKLHLDKYLCDALPEKYIRGKSDLKKNETIGDYVYVDYFYKIDIDMLEGDLCKFDGICSTPFFPSIAVLSEPNNKLTPVAVSVVREFLIERGFEVFMPNENSRNEPITNLTRQIIGQGNDPLYQMAIKLGADIYVRITHMNCKRSKSYGVLVQQASITMEAFNTATDKLIGSKTGQSLPRNTPSCEGLVQEASQKAANTIIDQISRDLKKQKIRGKAYKIVLFSSSKHAQTVNKKVRLSLKSLTNKRIRHFGVGKNQFSYIVYLNGIKDIYQLFDQISNNYQGPGSLKNEFCKGAFLILSHQSGDQTL